MSRDLWEDEKMLCEEFVKLAGRDDRYAYRPRLNGLLTGWTGDHACETYRPLWAGSTTAR